MLVSVEAVDAAAVVLLLTAFFFGVTQFDAFSLSSVVEMVTIFLSVLLSPSSFNFNSFDLPQSKINLSRRVEKGQSMNLFNTQGAQSSREMNILKQFLASLCVCYFYRNDFFELLNV